MGLSLCWVVLNSAILSTVLIEGATTGCDPQCKNGGSCNPNKLQCDCTPGWIGSSCHISVCNPKCENGGTCNHQQQCVCTAEWTGESCETRAPFIENMEEKIYNLGAEFRDFAANFTITNSMLHTKLQSDLDSKFDTMLSNLTQVVNNAKKDLDTKIGLVMNKEEKTQTMLSNLTQVVDNVKMDLDEKLGLLMSNEEKTQTMLSNLTQVVDNVKMDLDEKFGLIMSKEENTQTMLSNLTQVVDNVKMDLDKKLGLIMGKEENTQAMLSNLTLVVNNVKMNLESMLDLIMRQEQNAQTMLPNLSQVVNNVKKDLDAKLDVIMRKVLGICPADKGFFKLAKSDQCFKFFKDNALTWEYSKKKCEENGLMLAKPDIAIMLDLRKYIMSEFEQNHRIWLGGRGTGSIVKWTLDGTSLSNSESVWHPYFQDNIPVRASPTMCLDLLTEKEWLTSHPAGPIYTDECTHRHFRLCEL